ncbi:MAG: O-antigen ligase family protein, partial [Nitrososphaerales archaeon]
PVLISLALFACAYCLRAAFTGALTHSDKFAAVEAIGLPVVSFAVAYRFAGSRESFERVARAMAVAGAILAVIGLGEVVFGFELATRSGGVVFLDQLSGNTVRISGPYATPEVFGLILVICLCATLYVALTHNGHVRQLAALAAVLEVTSIGYTLFRTFWACAVLAVILVVGIRRRRPGRALATLMSVVVVILLLYAFIGNSTVISSRLGNTQNITGRFDVYELAGQIFERSPIVGVGFDQFTVAEQQLPLSTALIDAEGVKFPHNSYTDVLAEDGLLGFVPLVALTFAVGWLIRRLRRRAVTREEQVFAAVVLAAAVTYFLTSMTLEMLPYGDPNAFLAILLGAGAGRLEHFARSGSSLVHPSERPSEPVASGASWK